MTTLYVAPVGDLDMTTATGLRSELSAAIADETATAVVVTLEQVRFVDSTGLNALIAAHVEAQARGVDFGLRRPPSQLQRLLAITQTHGLFRWV